MEVRLVRGEGEHDQVGIEAVDDVARLWVSKWTIVSASVV